ncbi:hypothetical protein IT412_01290, partial [Candidatus Peregrinibacteria bacterium]|nr:hypothetical protein [Candidatus Peregrinibacteria bacterium]
MENLDGKFFEKTITALQNAKKGEQYSLRPAFRDNLRQQILARAALIPQESNSFDWSELVLRWKYVLGAVPVLAVLSIVAINFASMKVDLPQDGVIKENTNLSQEADLKISNKAVVLNNEAPVVSDLVTFSAASVMPPDELLKKNQKNIVGNSVDQDKPTVNPQLILDSVNVQILNKEVPVYKYDLNNGKQDLEVSDGVKVEKVPQFIQENEHIDQKTEQLNQNVPLEQSGRVENSAKVQENLPVDIDMTKQMVLPAEVQAQQMTLLEDTAVPEAKTLKVNETSTDQYINPSMEINQISDSVSLINVFSGVQFANKYLVMD